MNYFFTADEHYNHRNIIRYCNRPFTSAEEMNEALIENHNKKVSDKSNNITIHAGDFHWSRLYKDVKDTIIRLNGKHIFLRGSHDTWMNHNKKHYHTRFEKNINGQFVVADHYAYRVWPRSHFGSWMLYGHSHGKLPSFGKSYDVGVDTNNFEPVSFDELRVIMNSLEDNFNLIRQ